MLNSVAASRRLAHRAVVFQASAMAATALICLALIGVPAAVGVFAGGGAATLGSAMAAWRATGGGVIGSGVVLLRLVAATALKWMLVVLGLYLALSVLRLPAAAVIAGAVIATVAWLPAAIFAGRLGAGNGGMGKADIRS